MPPFPHQFASAWAYVGFADGAPVVSVLARRGFSNAIVGIGSGYTFTLDQPIAMVDSVALIVPGQADEPTWVEARAWVTRPSDSTVQVVCTIGPVEARNIRPFYLAVFPLNF